MTFRCVIGRLEPIVTITGLSPSTTIGSDVAPVPRSVMLWPAIDAVHGPVISAAAGAGIAAKHAAASATAAAAALRNRPTPLLPGRIKPPLVRPPNLEDQCRSRSAGKRITSRIESLPP